MNRDNDRVHRPDEPKSSGTSSDANEEFANAIDRSLRASASRVPSASALDPNLWERILKGSRPPKRRKSRQAQPSSSTMATSETTGRGEVFPPPISHRRPPEPTSIPAAKWHRGLTAFLVVALTICVIVLLPERTHKPQYGAILNAPIIATPSPIDTENCSVEPLTTEEVYDIVIGRGRIERQDARTLFTTPPPVGDDFPHTHTWLPEANGTVRLVDRTVDVSQLLPTEFQNVEASLNRYLRCQEEGTNYQLWALESEVEVQRQILQLLVQDLQGNEEITETMIVDEIERLGPLPRQDGQYLGFTRLDELRLEANPSSKDAFIFRGKPNVTDSYAWIGSQLVNDETGEVVMHRGARVDEPMPVRKDGSAVPMVGVFILVQHEPSGEWLVEWFIPSV